MPPLSKTTVKGWFPSRGKPLSTQFAQWIEACVFHGELIPIENISGIEQYFGQLVPVIEIETEDDYTYQIPEGYSIYQIYLKSENAGSIRIGTESGLDDLVSDTEIEANKTCPVTVNIPADEDTDIFFGGISHPTTIKIYLHKI